MPLMALLFLLSLGSTWWLADSYGSRESVQGAFESAFCPTGWRLEVGRGPTPPRSGTLARSNASIASYCVSPQEQWDYCQTCVAAAASPLLVFVSAAAGSFLWSLRRKPTALDHLAQLDAALGLGALSRAQYDELRRDVLAEPEMTRDRFHAAMRRARRD